MKLTIFSNFLNHHQIPLCDAWYQILGSNFTFVACEQVPKERLDLGYSNDFIEYKYLLDISQNEKNEEKAKQLAYESDVVIFGDAPFRFFKKRIKANKLTFRYAERFLKKGYIHAIDPRVIWNHLKYDTFYRHNNYHLLCASAYAPIDYAIYGAYPSRKYKWGYFPEMYETLQPKNYQIKPLELLWVGRFLDWKQPLVAIKTVKALIDKNIPIRLKMIGMGPMQNQMETEIAKLQLNEHITIVGPLQPDRVRRYMQQVHIFLATSTKQEGWGAVLNEAMNSGCVCFASYVTGAAPYLIEHHQNGVMYYNSSDLINKLEYYITHADKLKSLGMRAFATTLAWNPRIVAVNFIDLCNRINKNETINITNGPCSKALRLTEKHVLKRIKEEDALYLSIRKD